MAMDMALVKSEATATSTIAFAREVTFLAAGTAPGIAGLPALRILRSSPGDHLFQVAASFASPAAFCRISWAKPTMSFSSSCQAGLIAGGLENGVVGVWNPDEKLRNLPFYLPNEYVLEPHPDDVERWITRDFEVIEDYMDVAPDKRRDRVQSPASFPENTGNLVAADLDVLNCATRTSQKRGSRVAGRCSTGLTQDEDDDDGTGMIAKFAKHSGQVRGLSFNPCASSILASGATDGRILLYDLENGSAETVPVLQLPESSGIEVSYLSWNPVESNILASSSNNGKICVWDVNAKSALKCTFVSKSKGSSIVEFCPLDSNYLLIANEDIDSSVTVWDRRYINENPFANSFGPIGNLKGVSSLSWCPYDKDLLLCTTNNKIMIWNMTQKKIISETSAFARCLSAEWSTTSERHFATSSEGNLSFYTAEFTAGPQHCVTEDYIGQTSLD